MLLRTALLRFRRSAPKCSLSFLRCPALSVGDANFLSVSENQSLVHRLSLFQLFSQLKYVFNITIPFFILQELFLIYPVLFCNLVLFFLQNPLLNHCFFRIYDIYARTSCIFLQDVLARLTDSIVPAALPRLFPADCLHRGYFRHIYILFPRPASRRYH